MSQWLNKQLPHIQSSYYRLCDCPEQLWLWMKRPPMPYGTKNNSSMRRVLDLVADEQ